MTKKIDVECPYCGTVNLIQLPEGGYHLVECGGHTAPSTYVTSCGMVFAVQVDLNPRVRTYVLNEQSKNVLQD